MEENNVVITQEDVLSALGPDFLTTSEDSGAQEQQPNETQEQQPDNNTTNTEQTDNQADNTQAQQNEAGNTEQSEQAGQTEDNTEQLFNGGRQNQAFAKMRVENNQYKNILTKLGESIGIQGGNLEATVAALQTALLQRQSDTQKIPVETLRRIEHLEQQNAVYQQDQMKQQALLGFDNLKKEMNLKDSELKEFAMALNEKGIDPFTSKVDLIREYKMLNFDKLLAKAKAEGIAEEAQRASKAAQHSTTPSSSTGAKNDKVDTIKSVSDLNALLSQKLS